MLPLKSSFYVFYDENVTLTVFVIQHVTKDCAIVADHEDTRWLWIARMVCGAQWSPARKTRLSVELSTNIREVSQCPEIANKTFSVLLVGSAY